MRGTRRATATALSPITLVAIGIIAMVMKVLRFHRNVIQKMQEITKSFASVSVQKQKKQETHK